MPPDDDFDDLELEEFDDLDAEEEERNTKTRSSKAKKEKPKGIGASQVAEKLGTHPKTFRAWLRNQVKSGAVEVEDHSAKARYSWGNWKDPELVSILKLWKESDHTRGGGRKKGKKADTKKAATKKASKKAPAKRRAKKAS